jgi:hypothetical protein
MKFKFLNLPKVVANENLNSVTFSGSLPQTEALKQAGIVTRRILFRYDLGYVPYFFYKSCTYVDKYKDGKEKRFTTKLDRFQFYQNDIVELFSPINLFSRKKLTEIYYILLNRVYTQEVTFKHKLLKVTGNRSFYEFIGKFSSDDLNRHDFNKSNYWVINKDIYLIVQLSLDINGNNPKFESVKFKIPYKGKDVIIDCTTTCKKDSTAPNPLYYLLYSMDFPRKWFNRSNP